MRIITIVVMVLAFTAFISGCTAPASTQDVTPQATTSVQESIPAETTFVSLKASSYNPTQLYIKAGTTVTWVNEEDRITRRVVHMPSDVNGRVLFESGALSPGGTFSYTFTEPGRYVYADPQHGGGRSPFVEVTK